MVEWWYWVLFFNQINPLLKAKIEKMCTKTKGRERKRSRLGAGGMHGCASQLARPCVHHHGSWCTPRAARGSSCLVRSRRFLNTAFWCTFGPRTFALDHPYWAYWASFTNFFDLLIPQPHSFSYYLAHHT